MNYVDAVVVVVFVIVWDLGFKAAAAAAPDKLHSQVTGSNCSSSSRHLLLELLRFKLIYIFMLWIFLFWGIVELDADCGCRF